MWSRLRLRRGANSQRCTTHSSLASRRSPRLPSSSAQRPRLQRFVEGRGVVEVCLRERERERERERGTRVFAYITHTHTHIRKRTRACVMAAHCRAPDWPLSHVALAALDHRRSTRAKAACTICCWCASSAQPMLKSYCSSAQRLPSSRGMNSANTRPALISSSSLCVVVASIFFLYTKQATVLVLSCLLAPLDTHTTTPHTHTHTHHFSLSIFDPLFEFVDSSITVHVCASPLPNTVRVQNLATYLLLLVIHTFPDKISHRERVFAALHLINAAGPFASAFHKVWCFALVRCLLFCCLLFLAAHKEPISSILAPVSMNDVHLPHPPAYRAACCDWPTRSGSACTS